MSESLPKFLIDVKSDPVLLRVEGRVTYTNCAPFSKLFAKLIAQGRNAYVIDFEKCTGMDSTFLGILAGVALEIRKMKPEGCFTICRLNERNMELIQNLGLHRIMNVEKDDERAEEGCAKKEVKGGGMASKEAILDAHESLVEANKKNKREFHDVIEYLKKQVEES